MGDDVASIDCPVCGQCDAEPFAEAQDREYCTSEKVYVYRRCRQCRSVFIDPPPVDRLREIYPPNYYSYDADSRGKSWAQSLKEKLDARMFKKLLGRIPGDELAVLDVGGGCGWLLSLLRSVSSRVAETHELDFDESARAGAEAAGHVFHAARVEQFEPDRPFDLILMLNLIEHVADPGAVLAAMSRALSPQGLLLIKTPNVDTLDCRLFRRAYWAGLHCPRHFVLFTRESLIDLAQRNGLECVSARYTQGSSQWAGSIMASMASRGWITITSARPMHTHWLFIPLSVIAAAFDILRQPFAKTAQMFVTLKRA